MDQVTISALAQSDLDRIWDYISEKNAEAAEKFVKELGQKFHLLGEIHTSDALTMNLLSTYEVFRIKTT